MEPTDLTDHAPPLDEAAQLDETVRRDPAAPVGEGWDDVPETLRPRKKLPKWPFVLAGILLLIGGAIAAAWPIDVPYYALSPGPVNDTSDFVEVPEEVGDIEGDLFFLTVSLREINALEYVGSFFSKEVDLSPQENIRPAGVSQEELREQNLNLMESSKTNAIFVALTELGYEVTYDGSGAEITSVIEGSAADGLIETGDVIVAVNGSPVEFSSDAVDLVRGYGPGEVLELTIERFDEEAEATETLDVSLTLGPFRFVNEDGTVEEDPDRGMIGVLLVDAPVTIVFPVDVMIDSQNIGGPSAGLMFTLEIMNQLTEEDMTAGYRIAGTGTIDAEGNVGAIGGVRQKVFGAIDVGADYVLVPSGNFPDAADAAGDDIDVISIATIDDALSFLEELDAAA
jgi:PDZ domain-containing protein